MEVEQRRRVKRQMCNTAYRTTAKLCMNYCLYLLYNAVFFQNKVETIMRLCVTLGLT